MDKKYGHIQPAIGMRRETRLFIGGVPLVRSKCPDRWQKELEHERCLLLPMQFPRSWITGRPRRHLLPLARQDFLTLSASRTERIIDAWETNHR